MNFHFVQRGRASHFFLLLAAVCLATVVGCSDESPDGGIAGLIAPLSSQPPTPPMGVVSIGFLGEELSCWPYTGAVFAEAPVDPINLVFTGQADPLQIRAALMALDGDRTAYGLPDAYPFNATWTDAIGDVQTDWSDGEGWVANYVQLQLGGYEPVRVHLRLFQTGAPFGDGVWTLGGAHFDLLIPGTADHQVLSWEIGEQLLMVDMMRSGLLDAANPIGNTGLINAAPSYRTIPAAIYNGLPDDLKYLILGPGYPDHVEEPVPIPSDGTGTILNIATAAQIVAGTAEQSFDFNYEQVIPKPICNPDGSEYVLVSGPVSFTETSGIGPDGRYQAHGAYQGSITITPWDPILNQPIGEPYPATVGNHFECFAHRDNWRVLSDVRQIAEEEAGSEFIMMSINAASQGVKQSDVRSKCLE